MGGGSSSRVWPQYDWQWVANQNGLELYQEKQHHWVAEKRKILLDNRYSLENEQQIYRYRLENYNGLVKVYSARTIQEQNGGKSSQMCGCSDVKQMVIYSERIPYRLSELPQLTFPESLYLLKESLYSFQAIYVKIGPLNINPQLIGINGDGHCRVWVNQNWALNHPSHAMPNLKTSNHSNISAQTAALKDEAEMIENLICVVEDKTQQGRFPNNFGNELRKNSSSFRDAKRFVNGYISNQKVEIPSYLKRDKIARNFSHFSNGSSVLQPQPVRYVPPVQTLPPPLPADQYRTTTTRYEVTETIKKTSNVAPPNFGVTSTTSSYKVNGSLPPPPVPASINRPSEPLGFHATAVRASEYVPVATVSQPRAQPEVITFGKPQLELGKDQEVRHSFEVPKMPEMATSSFHHEDVDRSFFKKYADHNSHDLPLASVPHTVTEQKTTFKHYSEHHNYEGSGPGVSQSGTFNFSINDNSRPHVAIPQASSTIIRKI